MSNYLVKPWRQIYLNQIWDSGLPEYLFRNKTHLLSIIRQYRAHFNSEVYCVYSDEASIALLFVEPVFLDKKTLNGYLIPLKTFQQDNRDIKDVLIEVGAQYYLNNQDFEQLVLHYPDAKKKVIPGNEHAMFLGDSIYPNALLSLPFAAADFIAENFIIFKFFEHHIVVTVLDNYIVQVNFLKPNNNVFEPELKKALTKGCFLNDDGMIESNRDIIRLYSHTKRLDPELEIKIIEQFSEYFSGKRQTFDLPYKIIKATEFQKAVWQILEEIPYGTVLSYVEVAERLTHKREEAVHYARAVGSACGRNPIGIIIPCHRVIGNDRSLTGFAGGTKLKGALLDLEFLNRIGGN